MAAQSLLAKLGMRLGTLGSAASLAVAFPLAEGDPSMAAHTSASRVGVYADRTGGAEKMGHVVMGTEVLSVGVSAITAAVKVNTPATAAVAGAGLNIGQGITPNTPVNGDVWITASGLFAQIAGSTVGPFAAGGGTIGGSIANTQVAVGSGVNTVAGSAALTFSSSNLTGTGNATFGSAVAAGSSAGFAVGRTGHTTGLNGMTCANTGGTDSAVFAQAGSSAWAGTPWATASSTFIYGPTRTRIGSGFNANGFFEVAATTAQFGSNISTVTLNATTVSTNKDSGALVLEGGLGVEGAIFGGSTVNGLGTFNMPAATTSIASANLPHGTAPSAPTNGDLWTTTTAMFVRINGATVQLGSGGGTIGGSIANTQVAYGSGANTVQGAANFTYSGTALTLGVATGNALTVSSTGSSATLASNSINSAGGIATASRFACGYVGTNAGFSELVFLNSSGNPGFEIGHSSATYTTGGGLLWLGNDQNFFYSSTALRFGSGAGATDYVEIASGRTTFGNINAPTTSQTGSVVIGGGSAAGSIGMGAGIINVGTLVQTAATTTASAGLNLPHGTAPSAPVNGDVWTTTAAMFVRINGATVQLGSGGGITGTLASGRVPYATGTSTVTDNAAMTFSTTAGLSVNLNVATATGSEMFGFNSGVSTMTGTGNTFVGNTVGHVLSSGINNTALGNNALSTTTTGNSNTAIGANTLKNLTNSVSSAVAVGASAQANIRNGSQVAVGTAALAGDSTPANNTGTGNHAFGHNVLTATSSGSNNTGVGTNCLQYNVSGSRNTAVGAAALASTTGGVAPGSDNTAVGFQAGIEITGGTATVVGSNCAQNWVAVASITALGFEAMRGDATTGNNTGLNNTAMGYQALRVTNSGGGNSAFGYQSMVANTSGIQNTAMGAFTLNTITANGSCVAIGYNALTLCTAAQSTAVGANALDALTSGTGCTAVGYSALSAISTSGDCTAVGTNSLLLATGASNTAVGSAAGDAISTGASNTAVGHNAIGAASTSSFNTAVGHGAMASGTGASNTVIGYNTGSGGTGGANVVVGAAAGIVSSSNSVAIGAASVVSSASCVAIGNETTIDSGFANTFASGSTTSPMTNVFFGNGPANVSPSSYTINGVWGTSGTSDLAGGAITIAGGRSTGSGAGGSVILATSPAAASSGTLNALVTRLTVDHLGNIVPGTAALATGATSGFIYMQTCAGAPSGAPTAFTGRCAMIYDTTNNKLWVYNGSWRGIVLV